MREFFGLSIDEARAVWVDSVQRLLPPTPPSTDISTPVK